ncbi:MAG: sulfurtransferase TusA family protein [Gammaproteobacteria bacterium]|nr:sulfurtransferase TusA family protein [Gammaproteobacteria bacterium]
MILDARRLLCPLPVIRTQDKVETMEAGDSLVIQCTDHGVINDIPAWCRINGHELVSIDEQDHEIVIEIRVGKTS